MNPTKIKLIECPRDAMQGWNKFIPTEKKIEYLDALLKVGFDTLDFGSFVSAKAIPQMADTKLVIPKLHIDPEKTKLLAIIANVRGAEEAVMFDEITYLGFPFSVSETFQQKNTSSGILNTVKSWWYIFPWALVIHMGMNTQKKSFFNGLNVCRHLISEFIPLPIL